MATRLILDTDIGTDVDDCLALAFLLGSPEFEIEGITCVYGDVGLRARMVRKLLDLAGVGGIPVMTGASETLLGLRPIYWGGHEGVGLLEPGDPEFAPDPENAVDYLVRRINEEPGEFHLLAIGPLTNIALALYRDPDLLRKVAGFTVMGGVFRFGAGYDLPLAEHNFRCDPEAAHVVFASRPACNLVPLDVTARVWIGQDGPRRFRAAGTPFLEAVATQVEGYPRFVQLGRTMLHDPLAAALIIRPDLATWADLQVDIELQGRLATAMSIGSVPPADAGEAPVRIALDVDIAAAEEFVISRIAAQPVLSQASS